MIRTLGYAVDDAKSPFHRTEIDRRDPGPRDVQIAVEWCGVCHSDLHTARSEWPGTLYPCIPGHEVLGRVEAVGAEVKGFSVGERAAVGCMVDSCRKCEGCAEGLEQYCTGGARWTYNSPDPHTGKHTYGGYTSRIVVDQDFVLRVSGKLDGAGAAPLLCAGITTWSPLRRWGAGPGKKVGVVGLGGLGHMGVKLAHALGAHVVLFTTSPGKAEDARRLGADEVVLSREASRMRPHAGSFDLIVDTVAAPHDLDALLGLLRRDGTLCLVGAPEQPHPAVSPFNLIFGRRSLAGSLIGGIRETQEMLDFCAEHGIVADVERIPIQEIDRAYERMLESDVRYRFSIDMSSLK
ncbi:MAG: NAD(P)-dependent alcohol dehydrogenase [Acidobacteria bacterium ACB2]|nr:NAD(P)-dependent alcohol dehydrogenase [Acidobacteria bacterium ACB2]